MKKRASVFLLSVLSTILLLPTILAQNFGRFQPFNPATVTQFINDVIFNIIIFAQPIFVVIIGQYESNDLFFTKILLFILLFVVVRKVMESTPFAEDNEKIGIIISLIVSILGIRFIGQGRFLESIFLQYGVLVIAITTIIPLVIFFYFVNKTNVGPYGRKVFWSIYIISLAAIWLSRYDDPSIPNAVNWIYGGCIAAALIFIFFDKSVQKYLGSSDFYRIYKEINEESIRELRRELADITEDNRRGIMPDSEFERVRKKIIKKIKRRV